MRELTAETLETYLRQTCRIDGPADVAALAGGVSNAVFRVVTPAGAFVVKGGPSRRALTAAMLDLASRGEIAFREESELLGLKKKVGIEIAPAAADAFEDARRARNGVRPLGPAERKALRDLQTIGSGDGYIEPDELLGFGAKVPAFDKALEAEVVRNGWFREPPSKATRPRSPRWSTRSGAAAISWWTG